MEEIGQKYDLVGKIKAIREIKNTLDRMRSQMDFLCTPTLTDMTLLPEIHRIFCQHINGRNFGVNERRCFIFVVQYLYCPRTLFGGKMRNGLRHRISRLVGYNAGSSISNLGRDTLFHYLTYSNFREETESAIKYIIAELKESERL